jgi:hypothetical protein
MPTPQVVPSFSSELTLMIFAGLLGLDDDGATLEDGSPDAELDVVTVTVRDGFGLEDEQAAAPNRAQEIRRAEPHNRGVLSFVTPSRLGTQW